MKRAIRVLLGVLLASALATAASADILPGIYRSFDLGGDVDVPRASQSEDADLVPKPGVGDVFHLASWDGLGLGAQWAITCGVQNAPRIVKGTLDEKGNGTIVEVNRFEGGTFFLSRYGPWGDKLDDANGFMAEVRVTVTTDYVENWAVRVRVAAEGWGCAGTAGSIVRFTTSECTEWGRARGWMPSDYPRLLDPVCDPVRTHGYWWELGGVTIEIRPGLKKVVRPWVGAKAATEPRPLSWGQLKVIYR